MKFHLPCELSDRLLKSEPLRRCELGECQAACCLYGVWLDMVEMEDILQHAVLIQPHLKHEFADPENWFENLVEEDSHSLSGRVVHCKIVEDSSHYGETACVFLRSDFKCSLQVAGELNGYHPWRFKPFYCILHPLDLTKDGKITLDVNAELLQEPGSCLRPANHPIPLLITFEPELKYLLGEKGYAAVLKFSDLDTETNPGQ